MVNVVKMMTMDTFDFFITLFYEFETSPLFIQVVIGMIFFSLMLSVILCFYLSIIRYRYSLKLKTTKRVLPQIEQLFSEILFGERKYDEAEILNEYLNIVGKLTPQNIQLAIEVMLAIKFNIPKASVGYHQIVNALQIENFLEKKLSFSNCPTKMKAIQRLQQLELKNLDSKVLPFAYSKNEALRREARFSHLHLSENDPYRFFDEITGELTYWDEINLLRLLKFHHEKNQLSSLGKWINYSKNTSLIAFLIKAAGYFKQEDIKEIIFHNTKSINQKVRTEAYLSLGQLKASEYEEHLMELFFTEYEQCQLAIITTIGKINSGKAANFLKKAYQEANTVELKKTIALVSYNYKSSSNLFEELKTRQYGFDKIIFNHIETQLIKFK